MKKFKYRLQKVLDFRMSLKDERKRELLNANQALHEAEAERDRLRDELLSGGLVVGQMLSVEDLTLRSGYSARMKSEFEKQIEVVAMREAEAAEAVQRYIEAAKDANALDTHKNRRFQEYTERIQKEEEKILDESAVQRAGRALIKEAKVRREEEHPEFEHLSHGKAEGN